MTDRRLPLPNGPTPTLLAAAFGRTDSRALSTAIRIAAVLLMTIATTIAAQISIPLWFTPVPFTLQPMVVLVGGAVLGPRLGAISQLLYLAAGLAGAPVFAASSVLPQGPARLLGPTGGYLMAYPLAAYVTGWLASRGLDRRYLTSVVAMAAGLAVVFAGGVSWLALQLPASPHRLATAIGLGFTPFIAADLLKLCLAATVLPALWRFTGLDTRR